MATSATSITAEDVTQRIGTTSEKALAYVQQPDARLSRLSRRVREQLIAELPAVTAGALLGPAALARHFIASAASGRYRDLFRLWDLFSAYPDICKPVLAERPEALSRARSALETATRLGLRGHADRLVTDITEARGLIWQWLAEILRAELAQAAQRPAVASALLHRDPDVELAFPEEPDSRWVSEAAAARQRGPLAAPVEALLAANLDRLDASIANLSLAHAHYPARVGPLVARIDLESPEIVAILAWARDHGWAGPLRERVQDQVDGLSISDRRAALAAWRSWRDRGVQLRLPDVLLDGPVDDLDPTRPETAELIALQLSRGRDVQPQHLLNELAQTNRQLAEKAYEAFVCARLDVRLPVALERNPVVRDNTRCPGCAAWTWVRPGHEQRCPRLQPAASETTR